MPAVASGERFSGRGRITEISAKSVDIHHERLAAVRGFDGTIEPMESMTMPFARSATSFDGLAVGDLVEFEFTVHYGDGPTLRLARIAKLPPGTALQLP